MEKTNLKKPIILAPVSNFTTLTAVLSAGADAVYFGAKLLNMRVGADNFELHELKKVVEICAEKNVETFLTMNTIVYSEELKRMQTLVKTAKDAGISAIICWDPAVIQECKKQNMTFNISTQASISNIESAKFYETLGADTIILARECSLKQIAEIKKEMKTAKVEIFIHGAMCVAVSGRCFMSQQLSNRSANRGDCLQSCRREYLITDIEEPEKKLVIGQDYVMSAKDLCSIPFIDKVIETGVDILKIEGRARSPEYAKAVVSAYRNAVDSHFTKNLTAELKNQLLTKVTEVYNRGFSQGFFFNQPTEKDFGTPRTKSTMQKIHLGIVKNYFKKHKVAEIKIEAQEIKIGDTIMIQGPTTGVQKQKVESMQINHKNVKCVKKGNFVAIKIDFISRTNDKVYLFKKREK